MIDKRSRAAASQRRSRRRKTILITLAVVAGVVTLLIYEQIALLYAISTLSVVALLFVVAFADIENARRPAGEPPPLDDSAALGTGIAAATPRAPGQRTARAARGRR